MSHPDWQRGLSCPVLVIPRCWRGSKTAASRGSSGRAPPSGRRRRHARRPSKRCTQLRRLLTAWRGSAGAVTGTRSGARRPARSGSHGARSGQGGYKHRSTPPPLQRLSRSSQISKLLSGSHLQSIAAHGKGVGCLGRLSLELGCGPSASSAMSPLTHSCRLRLLPVLSLRKSTARHS